MTSHSDPETEPGEFTDSELHQSRVDQFKAQLDVLKHVATLDTGGLLIVVALLEKVFKAPHYQGLIGLGALCLLASLGASGFACLSILSAFPRKGARRQGRVDRRDHLVVMLLTFLGFFIGVTLIALFFAVNWFSLG